MDVYDSKMPINQLATTAIQQPRTLVVRPFDRANVAAIEKALAGKAQLDRYPSLAVGRRCRIKAGAFRGLEGIVVRRNKLTRIVLQVSILGQGAAMEIDGDLLEVLD